MEEKNNSQEALLQMEAQAGKMRKKLLLILGGIALLAILLLGGILIADLASGEEKAIQATAQTEYGDGAFYEPYKGDIMSNKEYLDLDRKVYFADGSGMEVSMEKGNLNEFNQEAIFLYNYLQTIIAGDKNAYNACFNETYFQTHEPQARFNQQMLYGAKITYHSRGNDESGVWVQYKLEYMIYRNDGTFRRDIRSNESRPQYITLRVEPEVRIEKLLTHYEVVIK